MRRNPKKIVVLAETPMDWIECDMCEDEFKDEMMLVAKTRRKDPDGQYREHRKVYCTHCCPTAIEAEHKFNIYLKLKKL